MVPAAPVTRREAGSGTAGGVLLPFPPPGNVPPDREEIPPMKQTTKFTLIALACLVFLAGCNTIAGAGKDIQKAGEKIEGAAK